MKIRTKFFILFLATAAVPVVVVSTIIFNQSRKITRNMILSEEMGFIDEERQKFDLFLEHYIAGTKVVSEFPPIQGIIRSMETGYDPVDNSLVDQWKKRLTLIFSSFLQNDPKMFQLRFINEQGYEIVRVDSRNGIVSIVPDSLLQDKSGREYVQKTNQLKEGEIWISPLELNQEKGVIEIPHTPVIRICTPVFCATEGSRRGMIILNLSAIDLLNQLIEQKQSNRTVILIDQDGNFLHHPVGEKEFGHELGHEHNYFSECKECFNQIRENESGVQHDAEDGELRVWKRIRYNENDNSHYWVLISIIGERTLFAAITGLQRWISLLVCAILIVVAILAYRMSKAISFPIEQLKKKAVEISGGNYADYVNSHSTITRKDEIGELCRSFGEMAKKLIDANLSLEERVRQRTEDIRKSESQAQTVLDTVVDGIITIDERGLIETVNSGAEKMFGYRKEAITGKNISILMPTPYREKHDAFIRRYLQTGQRKVIGGSHEVTGQRKDGTTFPMLISVGETIVEGQRKFTGVARDITELKKVDEMKSEFISVVSHELRTPLTSIRGSLGLIDGGVTGVLPEKAKEMVTIAVRNSDRLIRLINDILDIEKIESGKTSLQIAPLELMPLIRQNIESNQGYAEKYNVEFVIKESLPDCRVNADRDALSQIITNLLSNAAKFSPENGTVEIGVTGNGGRIRVAVKDQGSGIPEEFQKKIFEKFAQSDSSDTRQKGGTGLGLSITRALLEKMDGTISFETAAGSGTVFFFELPESIGKPE